MKTDDLLMALLSSLCPPIGLVGSIVKAITSDKPNGGLGFALDLATSTMPSGVFWATSLSSW